MWKELRKGFNKAKVTADANSARFEVCHCLSLFLRSRARVLSRRIVTPLCRRPLRGARAQRELYEKYGILKDVMIHPSAQKFIKILEKLSRVELIGEPILPTTQIVILAFMGYRARVPRAQLVLVCALLLRVHPLIVLSVALVARVGLLFISRRLPKGYDARAAKALSAKAAPYAACPPLCLTLSSRTSVICTSAMCSVLLQRSLRTMSR